MSAIDWSKAPAEATGAMVANFDSLRGGGSTWVGKVEFVPYGSETRDSYNEGKDAWTFHERPGSRKGECPPPDVTVCEARHPGTSQWAKVKILADKEPGSSQRACRDENDRLWWASEFRPIQPTAEQIAAEERETFIREAMTAVNIGTRVPQDVVRQNILRASVEALYDAGYRKS